MHEMKRLSLLACVLSLLVATSGCGGDGQDLVTGCGSSTYVPNFAAELGTENLLYWQRFPLRVYVVRDELWTPLREQEALQGFDMWAQATGGGVEYVLTDDPKRANLRVEWFPQSHFGGRVIGRARIFYSGSRISKAEIELSVNSPDGTTLTPTQAISLASHEFGHALGINGHSPERADMMYFASGAITLTPRDVNTLKTAYCNSFSRSRSGEELEGPLQVHTVSCPGH
jgi:hypothetical protein